MVNLLLFSLMIFVSLNMTFARLDQEHSSIKRTISNQPYQQRSFRHLMGKLIDTDTNTIYHLEGQKRFNFPSNAETIGDSPMDTATTEKFIEDLACLQACYKCVEDYPVALKKKAADNCGPMCDCADSCSHMPVEKINQIYGQSSSARVDKGCFWKTYTEVVRKETA